MNTIKERLKAIDIELPLVKTYKSGMCTGELIDESMKVYLKNANDSRKQYLACLFTDEVRLNHTLAQVQAALRSEAEFNSIKNTDPDTLYLMQWGNN